MILATFLIIKSKEGLIMALTELTMYIITILYISCYILYNIYIKEYLCAIVLFLILIYLIFLFIKDLKQRNKDK